MDKLGIKLIAMGMKDGSIPRTIITRIRGKKRCKVEITEIDTIEMWNDIIKVMDEKLNG
jgi:hypothetical protein